MAQNVLKRVKENVEKVMVGQSDTIDLLLTAMISEGHVLIEDMPGTGKTVLSSSLAKSIQGEFSRIQFTPDLLPSDVTGLNYYNQKEGEFVFKRGPAFCNILLADEINRATQRTQSSLLECMAEKQITVDGVTRALPKPFLVVATQNPLETLGTFPLPEAQLDRFLMRIHMTPPNKESEMAILNRFMIDEPFETLEAVTTVADIETLMLEARGVYVHPLIVEYIADLAVASRKDSQVEIGISPRGSLALLRAAKSYAYLQERNYVVPEDIKDLAVVVLAHRIKMTGGFSAVKEQQDMIKRLLDLVPITTEEWSK
ncbi:MAG: MoxR family ATPase [Lachnospiraceae bacterium]